MESRVAELERTVAGIQVRMQSVEERFDRMAQYQAEARQEQRDYNESLSKEIREIAKVLSEVKNDVSMARGGLRLGAWLAVIGVSVAGIGVGIWSKLGG